MYLIFLSVKFDQCTPTPHPKDVIVRTDYNYILLLIVFILHYQNAIQYLKKIVVFKWQHYSFGFCKLVLF